MALDCSQFLSFRFSPTEVFKNTPLRAILKTNERKRFLFIYFYFCSVVALVFYLVIMSLFIVDLLPLVCQFNKGKDFWFHYCETKSDKVGWCYQVLRVDLIEKDCIWIKTWRKWVSLNISDGEVFQATDTSWAKI
jgi:hypothetical protein